MLISCSVVRLGLHMASRLRDVTITGLQLFVVRVFFHLTCTACHLRPLAYSRSQKAGLWMQLCGWAKGTECSAMPFLKGHKPSLFSMIVAMCALSTSESELSAKSRGGGQHGVCYGKVVNWNQLVRAERKLHNKQQS